MNLLFITADQLRADALRCAGNPIAQTPSLDALARDGIRFARHYSQAAPCGPSRASLHTSLYCPDHGSYWNGLPLDPRLPNWARSLRESGLDPVLVGYTHTALPPGAEPAAPRGFEGVLPGLRLVTDFRVDMKDWHDWIVSRGFAGVPAEPESLLLPRAGAGVVTEDYVWGEAPYPSDATDTAFLVEHALDFLAAPPGRPWALHVSLFRPHDPYLAPRPYHRRFSFEDVAPPAPAPAGAAHEYTRWQREQRRNRLPKEIDDLRPLKALYLGLVAEVDHQIGRLLDRLRETGDDEDTLVVFTSDHGDQLGDQDLMGKCGFYDASFNVPLLLRDPSPAADRTRGRVVDAFTENVDVAPTLLDYADVDVPKSFVGRSLRDFCRGARPADWRQEARWVYAFPDASRAPDQGGIGLRPEDCRLAVARDAEATYVGFPSLPDLWLDHETGELTPPEGLRAERLRRAAWAQFGA